MPLYEYRCEACGSFDQRRDSADATSPLDCPSCARPARRVYTAPGGRSRSGPLAAAGRGDRARIDRALTGEPARTPCPPDDGCPRRPTPTDLAY